MSSCPRSEQRPRVARRRHARQAAQARAPGRADSPNMMIQFTRPVTERESRDRPPISITRRRRAHSAGTHTYPSGTQLPA